MLIMAAASSFSLLKRNDYDWLNLLITTMAPGTTMHKKKMTLVAWAWAKHMGHVNSFVLQIKFF
jgi:hypothetical protein